MKTFNTVLAAALVAAAPVLVLAQAPAADKAAAKPAAKPAATSAAKTAPKKDPSVSTPGGKLRSSAAKAVEENTPIDDDPNVKLSEADLEIAKRVHVGTIPCELGASVSVTAHRREGFFVVQHGKQRYRVHPVESRTGAIRLEDPRNGVLWLQLGNKSMLMSQKLGQRLADECAAPAQTAFAEEMKKNPPRSILESAPAAAATAPASGAK